jgi:2'-5' RNA ligase
MADDRPIIASLTLDPVSQAYFDARRGALFPPERNHLRAHLTLFHALPGDAAEEIRDRAEEISRRHGPIRAHVTRLIRLGRGVAYELDAPGIPVLRDELGRAFADRLTPQDRQPIRPHITVQNKVEPEEAERTYRTLQHGFMPVRVTGTGLSLWHYDGGPWAPFAQCAFTGEARLDAEERLTAC